ASFSRAGRRPARKKIAWKRIENSEALLRLSAAQVDQLVLSMEAIAEYGETVASAVLFRIAHLKHTAIHGNKTVGQVADEAVAAKLRDGMSQHYVHSLKSRLDRFCRDF